jgi:hypothetical protein
VIGFLKMDMENQTRSGLLCGKVRTPALEYQPVLPYESRITNHESLLC